MNFIDTRANTCSRHGSKEIPTGTVNRILKDAGLR